jgi:hypothetical protein
MKNIMMLIISFSIIFSSAISVSANGVLWNILELDTWVEKFQIQNIPTLPIRYFTDSSIQSTYNNFIIIDQALREECIKQYHAGKINYYQMQDLIHSYSNFVYHTEKTFGYIWYFEKNSRRSEIQNAIISWYSSMRMNYNNIIHILK